MTHTLRFSEATILADNGSTLVNLKQHNRCSDDYVAKTYIDNSRNILNA